MHILLDLYNALVHSDIPNIIQDTSGIVAVWALRKFNCKVPHCWRIARHPVEGTTYHTCTKHTTTAHHGKLFIRHAARHPEQHELLSKESTCTSAES